MTPGLTQTPTEISTRGALVLPPSTFQIYRRWRKIHQPHISLSVCFLYLVSFIQLFYTAVRPSAVYFTFMHCIHILLICNLMRRSSAISRYTVCLYYCSCIIVLKMTDMYEVETSNQWTIAISVLSVTGNIDIHRECYTEGDGPYKDSRVLSGTCRAVWI
jgi:hypothetical protein